jgi:hypothetical protein
MVRYGLVGVFVVDSNLTIKTVYVSPSRFDELLKQSLLYLLAWVQRTTLVAPKYNNIKALLSNGINMNYELNNKLIMDYLTRSSEDRRPLVDINNKNGKFGHQDMVGSSVYITETGACYYLFVDVKHGEHVDTIPLLSLNNV